jgi:splicing factor 3B subunit 3
MFFILLQSELGDLYKLTVNYQDDEVKELRIKYYDTVPTSTALCILRSGFLFVPAECGNHHLYQIESLADDESDEEVSSMNVDPNSSDLLYFTPHPIQHLAPIAELDNWTPLIDAKLYNLIEDDTPQIYALCGRGARSTFRIMRRGLESSEMVSYPLPGSPIAVWTLKTKRGGKRFCDVH